MKSTGIYIHVPFCSSKCPYCDFYSVIPRGSTRGYTDAVVDEIKTLRRNAEFIPADFKERSVDTLYIGGGTPSVLACDELKKIIGAVRENFILTDDAEITAECNPSSEGLGEKLKAMASAGVNRVSFGMQSADDGERKKLGRKAGRDGVAAAVELARAAGIESISLDIMLGIPGQTLKSLRDTLDFAVSTGARHLSAYMLKIEENTFFGRNAQSLNLPDDDETADMYLAMCEFLEKEGFRHYEISNFCREGYIARHNMKYWTDGNYLGIGPAAHSYIDGKRFYSERNLDAFIAGEKAVFESEGGGAEEKIMLGLRTDAGIEIPEKAADFCEKLKNGGLAVIRNGRLSLTSRGMLISNSIISEILSETGL